MTATADLDLAFAGPGAQAESVRNGSVQPRELVELYLRRIETLDPGLNAFRAVLADQALAEADGDERRRGLLAGVPIAVKDDQALAGQPTTYGSRSFGSPARRDAEVVRRLRAAGAIPIGITNVPELMIFPWTATDANGVTRNPWNPAHTPGGSSGGSAAAVAAGLAAAATASDGGGSIRIPAAACGLVGMKPTRGRVAPPAAGTDWLGLSTYGALARTVGDSALMLDVLRGAEHGDAQAAPEFAGRYVDAAARPPGRLQIALSRKVPPGQLVRISAEQRDAHEQTGALLSQLGHDVSERDPAYGMVGLEFVQTWMRGIYEQSLYVPDPSRLERSTRQMAAAGRRLVPAWRRAQLLARRPRTTARILALWDEVDVLVTPGMARTAIGAEGAWGRSAPVAFDVASRFTPFTAPFNVTGQPAITLPAGIGADGLPLSVQLIGRLGAEHVLYSLAAQIESAAPWAGKRPPL